MAYKGKYIPINPKKYVGNSSQIIYRSLWERKLMVYCDRNDNIIEWGSEEVIVPYRSPWDGKIHRYFPDFYMKVKQTNGTYKKFIIEVKPKLNVKNLPRHPNVKLENGIKKCKLGVLIKQSGSLQQTTVRTEVWNLRYLLKTT